MPEYITDEYKRKRLEQLGLDPNTTNYDEYFNGNNYTPSSSSVPTTNGSALSALGQGARRSIGGTIGGVGGAALGVALAPETFGLSLLLPLALGFGGAYAGGKTQEFLEPKIRGENDVETQARLTRESALAQEHPVASFTGEVLPSLAAFRPSISSVRNLGKGLANVGRNTSIELPLAQKAAVANAAVNSVIGGGSSIATDIVGGNDIDYGRALAHAGVNALLSEPTRVGRMLGFKSGAQEQNIQPIREIPLESVLPKTRRIPLTTGIEPPREFINAGEASTTQLKSDINVGAKPEESNVPRGMEYDPLGEQFESFFQPKRRKVKTENLIDNTPAGQYLSKLHGNPVLSINKPAIKKEILKAKERYNEAVKRFGEGYAKTSQGRMLEDLYGQYKNPTVIDAISKIEKKLTGEPNPNQIPAIQDSARPLKPLEQKTYPLSEAEGELIAREGVNARAGKIYNSEGVEQAGEAKVGTPDRQIRINPDGRNSDTTYHEVAHHRFRELLNNPKTRKLADNLLRHFNGDEEALIQSTGENYEAMVRELGVSGALKNFYKDFVAGVKGDAGRILASKLRHDAPYAERLAARDLSINPRTFNQLRELTDKQIAYKGYQEGYGSIPGFNLYNILDETLHPKLAKGSTVSDATLNKLGFKAPDSIVSGQSSQFQPLSKEDRIVKGLNPDDVEEIKHKLNVLRDTDDLMQDYNLTSEQVDSIISSLPVKGDWEVPEFAVNVVKNEMQNHTQVLYDIANDARSPYDNNAQSRKIKKQADKFNSLFQPKKVNDFETSTERELRKERPFGLTIGNDGSIPVENLRAKMSKLLPNDEYAALVESGLDEFIGTNKRVNASDLGDWIRDNGPKVEVKKLGANLPQSAEHKELAALTHNWYERLTDAQQNKFHDYEDGLLTEDVFRQWLKSYDDSHDIDLFMEHAERYKELRSKNLSRSADSDSATARYTMVNPKPLNEMEGAVDILVRKPINPEKLGVDKNASSQMWTGAEKQVAGVKFDQRPHGHFKNSDVNIVGWVRGYMEILPTGEKVFHVFELQSDWAQQVIKAKTDDKGNVNEPKFKLQQDDPLLNYYESLALKAAIKHAKENGAEHIAISDAETAMLTEGHDNVASQVNSYSPEELEAAYRGTEGSPAKYFGNDWKQGKYLRLGEGAVYRIDKPESNFNRSNEQGNVVEIAQTLSSYKPGEMFGYIPQAKGMRQHYDQNIPNILKKLTGDKGKVVEFGEHQNAFKTKEWQDLHTGPDTLPTQRNIAKQPREDLIFKDSKGNPKTSITALMFDITDVPALEKPGEIFRGSFYQGIKQTGNPQIDNINPGSINVERPNIARRIASRLNPFNITKSELQRVAGDEPKNLPSISEALGKQRVTAREREGQFRGLIEAFSDLPKNEQLLLYKIVLAERKHETFFKDAIDNPRARESYDRIKATNEDIVNTQNYVGEKVKEYVKQPDGSIKIEMRPRKINPFYFPHVVSGDAMEALSRPESPEAIQLKKDLIDHYVKHYGAKDGKKFGEESFAEYMSNSGRGGEKVSFGPNRKAEGIGLPESWIEADPINAMKRFVRRTSNDLAFFEHLEKNPVMARMIGIPRDQDGNPTPTKLPSGVDIVGMHTNPNVKNILDIITGESYSKSPALDAGIGVANSLLLGPISGLVDVASIPFNAVKYAPTLFDAPKLVIDGIKNFKQGLRHSYENGINTKNPADLRDLFVPTSRLAQKLTTLRDGIYTIQGRKSLEQFSRGMSQSMMESAVEMSIARAKMGDKSAQRFLQKLLGKDVDVNNIDISKAGSIGSELLQGTYDFRNLPIWAIDSNIAPFFRLARWNIEQMNNFGKYVWEPATKGNFTPLILSTLGAVAGGALVKEIRERTNDKKSYVPSLAEIVNSSKGVEGNLPLIAYKLMALSSYVGYAGIASDLARSALDVVLLHNKPQSVDFPFMGMIQDSTQKVMDAIGAIKEGDGDYLDIATKLAGDLLKNNLQIARLANTWLVENTGIDKEGKETRERIDKFTDLRNFKQVEGLPVTPLDKSGNQYAKKDIKEFKRTKDIQEARRLAPRIIDQARESGDYTQTKARLDSVRANAYNTVPSPKSNPQMFARYVAYIRRTQGDEAVKRLLQDYYQQQSINSVKKGMIPALQ